jgi:hypothetical protein
VRGYRYHLNPSISCQSMLWVEHSPDCVWPPSQCTDGTTSDEETPRPISVCSTSREQGLPVRQNCVAPGGRRRGIRAQKQLPSG